MIHQKAHGTASGAIIDMAIGICSILDRLNHRLTKLESAQCCCKEEDTQTESGPTTDVQLPVPKVQDTVRDTTDSNKVSDPQVLQPTNKTAGKAKKGTAGKANSRTK
jgi:hypothetical protein